MKFVALISLGAVLALGVADPVPGMPLPTLFTDTLNCPSRTESVKQHSSDNY